ncbi:MAG: energy-coupling factor transporter transmembrane component T [Tissierellia bacterium]|nr:energy-coupling factor transporter transmembrane component T [Tissierellia bacterium]
MMKNGDKKSIMLRKKYYLHPLSILIFMTITSILGFITTDTIFYLMILLAFVIELFLKKDQFLKSLLFFIIVYFVVNEKLLYTLGYWGGSLHTMLFVIYRLSPLIILSKAMTGFTSTELMSAYRKVGLQDRICIGIAIFFRFLPEFRQRMKEIREGARLRGLKISLFHPLRSLELFLVPMMFKGLALSDTITASIITKGIEYEGEKTNYRNIGFSIFDGVLIGIGILLIGVTIWLKIL